MELRRALALGTAALAAAARLRAQPAGPQTFGTQVAYERLDASEFGPFVSGNHYGNLTVLRYAQTVTGYGMVAPLHLPSGASIVSIELDYFDDSPTGSAAVALVSCDNAPGVCAGYFTVDGCVDGGASACSGAAAAPGFGSSHGTFGGIPVDNYAHQYLVVAATTTTDATTAISSVRIGYLLQVSPAPAGATFADVPTSHPFFQFIEALAASGITGGCGGGNFCPDAPLTRGQMAVFLAKALGLSWN